MFKRSSVWRGLTLVFSLLLAISLMAGSILETIVHPLMRFSTRAVS